MGRQLVVQGRNCALTSDPDKIQQRPVFMQSQRNHRVLLTIVLAASALLWAAGLFFAHLQRDAKSHTASALETVLRTTHQALRSWADTQKSAAGLAASSPSLARLTENLLSVGPNAEQLRAHGSQQQIRALLQRYLTMFNFEDYFIVGPGNLNLSAMGDATIGQESVLVARSHMLARLWDGETVLTLPQHSDFRTRDSETDTASTLFVGTAIQDHAGKPIAVLALRINPHRDFTRLLSRGRLGDSGETYAMDRNGVLLSESRFESRLRALGILAARQNAMLNVAVTNSRTRDGTPTLSAAAVLRGESGAELEGYTNYLGTPVVGAWAWDPDLGLGLISEMEKAEAYAAVWQNTLILGLLIGMMITMVAGVNISVQRNREKVTASREQLRQVMDLVPHMILAKNEQGEIILANKAAADLHGTDPRSLCRGAKTAAHWIPPADGDPLIRDRQIMATGERQVVTEETFVDARGVNRTMRTVRIPFACNRRSSPAVLYFATDVSEQKETERILRRYQTKLEQLVDERTRELADNGRELRESEEHRRLILDSAGEGIFGIGLEGRATFINPAAADMLGYAVEELAGREIHPLILHHRASGEPYPFDQTPIHAAMTAGTVQHVTDEVLWRKDGVAFPVEYVATPIRRRGEVIGAVVSFNDITHRKEVERMKSEFVSVVSHELRTPLTSIRGSLGLLLMMKNAQLPAQTEELLHIAHRNSERLLLLINDLLDMEKIASGKMVFDLGPQPIVPLIEQAMANNRAYADQYGVTYRLVRAAENARVNIDGDRLTQVLNNLLSNATKFSPRGDQVDIAVDREDRRIRVSVTDRGPGIAAEFRQRIFQKFSQADSSDTRQKGGTGLGLAISKSIIDKMGGEIGFDSTVGAGTTFYFLLPEAAAPQEVSVKSVALEAMAED